MSFSISQDNSQLISFLKQINYSNYNSEYSDDFINLSNIWYGSNKITNQIAQLPTIPPQLFQPYVTATCNQITNYTIPTEDYSYIQSLELVNANTQGVSFTFIVPPLPDGVVGDTDYCVVISNTRLSPTGSPPPILGGNFGVNLHYTNNTPSIPYIIDRGRRQSITTPTLNVGDSITLQKTVSFGSRFTFRINGTVIPISPPLIEFILTTPCRAYIYGGLQLLKLFLNKIKHFLKKTKN